MKNTLFLFLLIICENSYAQPGGIDSTFGTDGMVTTNLIPGISNSGRKIALTSDDGFYICGHTFSIVNNLPVFEKLLITKHLSNGSLDNSFNNAGTIIIDNGVTGQEALLSVAVQADDKPVFAGWASYNDTTVGLLIRLNTDGTFDTTFNSSGVFMILGQNNARFNDIIVQPDGKIVAVGETFTDITSALFTIRLNANGTLDNTYNGSGINSIEIPNIYLKGTCVTQYNNNIYIGGMAERNFGKDILLVGLNGNGQPIPGFGNNGIVIDSIANEYFNIYDIEADNNGRLVAAGIKTNGNDLNASVFRYNNDGSTNTTFGSMGIAVFFNGRAACFGVCIQNDDKIIAAGYSDFVNNTMLVARLDIDGNLDTTFGNNGIVEIEPMGVNDVFSACAIQQDNKIICAGTTQPSITTGDFIAIRFLSGLEVGLLEFSQTETAPLLYPNPLQQTETLKYTLAEKEQISITLIDSQGKLVTTFVENENQAKGDHEIKLTLPPTLSPGTYFIQIASPKGTFSIKAIK